jgi:hypothetical protein
MFRGLAPRTLPGSPWGAYAKYRLRPFSGFSRNHHERLATITVATSITANRPMPGGPISAERAGTELAGASPASRIIIW